MRYSARTGRGRYTYPAQPERLTGAPSVEVTDLNCEMRLEGACLVLENAAQWVALLWLAILQAENDTTDEPVKERLSLLRREFFNTLQALQAERALFMPSTSAEAFRIH